MSGPRTEARTEERHGCAGALWAVGGGGGPFRGPPGSAHRGAPRLGRGAL